ncbi:MAG: methionine--tRNA ligase, partial [Actinomadura rubrobrunea]|nr:methionine--tRNA ligase [Actinomadura rubrobrunea]
PPRGGGPEAADLDRASRDAAAAVDAALADFDFRRATGAVWDIVDAANRYINRVRPWELARADGGETLDAVLARLVRACRDIAGHLEPFLPDAAARVARQCAETDGRLPEPSPVFTRLG